MTGQRPRGESSKVILNPAAAHTPAGRRALEAWNEPPHQAEDTGKS